MNESRAAMKKKRGLSNREKQVMDLVCLGKLNKEIAIYLGVSLSTVEKHLSNIYAKLKVRNRTEAALHYRVANSRKPQLRHPALQSYHSGILSDALGSFRFQVSRMLKGVHMSKRDLITSVIAGLILGIIAIGPILNGSLFAKPVEAQSEIDAIRQLMLASHNNWSTLEGEFTTTWYLRNGETSVVTSDFSIEKPGQIAICDALGRDHLDKRRYEYF